VDGIVNGHMTLVYEQLIRTNGGESILESMSMSPALFCPLVF
jgi:hypothetical protein